MISIIDSSGYPLDQSNQNIEYLRGLKDFGYTFNEDTKKMEMKKIIGVAFRITRSGPRIFILGHVYCKKGDIRPDRYYIFYITDMSSDISKILKDFLTDAEKEAKKYDMDIVDNYQSLFLFKNIRNAIDDKINNRAMFDDKELSNTMSSYIGQNAKLQLEVGNIENALKVLMVLDNLNIYDKITYIMCVDNIYDFLDQKTINIFISQEKYIGIKVEGEFRQYIHKCRQDKYIKIADNINRKISDARNLWIENRQNLSIDDKKIIAEHIYPNINSFKTNIENDMPTDVLKDANDNNLRNFLLWSLVIVIGSLLIYYVPINLGMISISLDGTDSSLTILPNSSILTNDNIKSQSEPALLDDTNNNGTNLSLSTSPDNNVERQIGSVAMIGNNILINDKIILLTIFVIFMLSLIKRK